MSDLKTRVAKFFEGNPTQTEVHSAGDTLFFKKSDAMEHAKELDADSPQVETHSPGKAETPAQKEAAEKEAAEKLAVEKEAADKEAADKLAADKLAADKEAADKEAADKEAAANQTNAVEKQNNFK